VARISRTYLPIKANISFSMDAFDHAPLVLPKMEDHISLTFYGLSVEAHCQDVVGFMSIRVLNIKAANASKMNCDIPMSILYDYQ
jgi:hypothetical protein